MIEPLNKPKINYILYHLNQHIELDSIKEYMIYGFETGIDKKPYIHFPLSEEPLTKNFRIDDLPVLYPLSDSKEFYSIDSGNNLVFNHDLLKSAFYLLSGYQETQPYNGDHLNRFAHDDSIQKELGITDWPIVNEYFLIISKGIEHFCQLNNIKFRKKYVWGDKEFALFLTHDVDRIDKWTLGEIRNRLKMVIKSGFLKHWGYLFEALINFPTSKNPYWNFEWMKNLENTYNFQSTWFFLPQGHPKIDAYYSLDEQRIKDLAAYLLKSGDEIALHGTYLSRENKDIMAQNLSAVQKLTRYKIKKSRQHWLSFKHPNTLRILENLNIDYDSSWGFAEHYGWRNSYCLPFHPYDIGQERMMDIVELPLNAMDVTFFQYMRFSIDETLEAFEKMLETCKKYNGLFVLLWHNSHFNETQISGITELYINILRLINSTNPYLFNTKNIKYHAI